MKIDKYSNNNMNNNVRPKTEPAILIISSDIPTPSKPQRGKVSDFLLYN